MILKMRSLQAIGSHWLAASTNRKIFGATVTVAVLIGLAKGAIVGKELVVAWQFGTSDALDAFLIAFLVPSFAVNIIAGSWNAALIPTYIQVREKEGARAAQGLYASVMLWSLVLLAGTTALIVLGAPLYLPWLAKGFGPDKLVLARQLLYMLSPVIMLSGVVTIWGAVLNAGESFAWPALSSVGTPLMATVFVLLAGRTWGILALTAGTVCGGVLEAAILGWALYHRGVTLSLAWQGFTPYLRQVIGQYIPMMAGAFLMSSTQVVGQAMAATLAPGSVAALNYGNKLIGLPLNLAATAVGTAVIPYFASMVARQEWAGVRHTLNRYLGLIFGFTVPLTVLLVVSSEPFVQIVFQRGAFTTQDTHLVARVQALASLQIPFYVAGTLVVRLVSAMYANHVLMWGAAINLAVNVVLTYLLMRPMGVAGIALSTSIMYLVSFLFLFYNCRRIYEKRR